MALIGALPAWLARRLGEFGGMLVMLTAGGRRKMVLRHGARLGFSGPDLKRYRRQVFAGYGRYWGEALWLRPRRKSLVESRTTAEGLDLVREAIREGRGMIFALPHIGNWEFAGPVARELGVELWAVAENLPNQRIREWFVALRNQLDIGIILATGGAAVMRRLEEVVGRNGAVALLCDRDLKRRGVPVRFFGEETTLPAGPVSLSIRTGAPVFPVAAYFTADGGHNIVVKPRLRLEPSEDRAAALREGTQQLAEALERLIAAAPSQWHLLQPNWPSDFEDDS